MTTEIKFLATPEKGEVSAILDRPDNAKALLVLGHGSGTNMLHALISNLSLALVEQSVATFRYQYPYSEKGGGGLDGRKVLLATVNAAILSANENCTDLPIFAGGHSMSGRMITLAEAESPLPISGIVCFAFPISGGKGPTERAEHFPNISKPMLFHQGTKDKLADIEVINRVVDSMKNRARIHIIETADHGYKVLKRSGTSHEEVIQKMAKVTSEWMDEVLR
jgi:hypothetical protein